MKFIKILPEGLIDRIAAGEVIENPASVVKELLENSIDARAGNIEIAISGGGKEEIVVVDDGEGIPKDQVELAFCRHATSKIRSWEDLLSTGTMGFRGEALPSISSVSFMEMTTYYDGEKTGTRIRIEGGRQVFLGPAPPKKGCGISVKNLFYNVPARRKFLKSDLSEKRRVSEVIRRYLIAHPEVSFKVSIDGREANNLAASDDLMARLESVWGDAVTICLISLESPKIGPLQIRGFVSKPESNRANRSEIYFFVNKRPVLERALFGAITASYGRSLPPGRYPYAAIFLDIDTPFVDINVHPAKTEVRFADEGFIFATLKKALDKALALPVDLTFRSPGMPESFQRLQQPPQPGFAARKDLFDSREFAIRSQPPAHFTPDEPVARQPGIESPPGYAEEPFLQIFDTYILTRLNGELVIIDQHTAHERILFERTLDNFARSGSPSQKLLFEERVRLTPEEAALIQEYADLLARAGFDCSSFGSDEILVSGLPQEMSRSAPGGAIKDVLANYAANLKEGQESKKALAAAVACKAAVRAGERLSRPQMKGLLDGLLRCREPYRCPHGRPTIVTLSRNDLEKIFKRK